MTLLTLLCYAKAQSAVASALSPGNVHANKASLLVHIDQYNSQDDVLTTLCAYLFAEGFLAAALPHFVQKVPAAMNGQSVLQSNA